MHCRYHTFSFVYVSLQFILGHTNNLNQLRLKHQRRTAWNWPHGSITVPQMRRNRQRPLLSNTHI